VTRNRWLAVGAAGLVVVVAVATWLLWPSAPQPRARQYLAFNACLLTDAQGLAGAAAKPVWAGMQAASLKTRAKVEYVPVYGEATAANATPYLNGLIQRHCDLILAAGPAQVAAVHEAAGKYRSVHFVVVDGGSGYPSNVSRVTATAPTEVRDRVAAMVTAAVKP
jgi:basic membrane lipoprotein Med (substrate-binding protein (PBP1-ABC) superfamily)